MPASPSARTDPSPGRRPTARAAVIGGVLVVGLVAAWVLVTRSNGEDPKPPAGPPPSTAAVDLSALTVERASFCGRLGATGVRGALDAPVTGSDRYRSGERVWLAPGVDDVSHEFGCTFTAATGARARVWVFAEPVTGREAVRIGRDVRREPRCRPVDARPFGRSPAGTVCPAKAPKGLQVTLRGLFGDAWLSCQVTSAGTEPPAEVVRRGGRWCVRVARALGESS